MHNVIFLKQMLLFYDLSLSVSSTMLIVIFLIISSGKQEMIAATELP